MFALGFSDSYLRKMEVYIDSRYAVLRRQLDGFARSGEVFDLRKYITYCIVDILGELAFGSDLGNQAAADPAKIPPVSDALYGAILAGQIPWAAEIITFVATHMPLKKIKKLMEGRDHIMEVAVRNFQARAKKPIERDDMLGRIMAAQEEKTGEPLTTAQVLAEAFTLVVGGTHTTGNTLHILLANLSRNPEHLAKAVAEIDERLPPLGPEQAAYSIAGLEEKLDFVNMAIKENFRKDPVATFNMPRTVPPEGAEIAGFRVPGGVSFSLPPRPRISLSY